MGNFDFDRPVPGDEQILPGISDSELYDLEADAFYAEAERAGITQEQKDRFRKHADLALIRSDCLDLKENLVEAFPSTLPYPTLGETYKKYNARLTAVIDEFAKSEEE